MLRFTIFGIPVLVHPFFWLTLAIIGGANSERGPDALFRLVLFLLAGFISILVHELGHALTARKFGAWSEIVLQAFGGYASYSGVHMTRPRSFAITAAGPAVQLLLGGILWLLLERFHDKIAPQALYFTASLTWISIVWAVFNLVPVIPLDGGRMLDALLGPKRIRITLWITILTAVAVGLGFLTLTGSIIAPIFMGTFAWQAWKTLRDEPWR